MDNSVSLTIASRAVGLAAQGRIRASVAAGAVGRRKQLALADLVAMAIEARCPITYLIDPKGQESAVDAQWTYTEEPQLLRFRRRLAQAMEMADIKGSEELSRRCGIAAATVASYLRGTRLPSATSLVRLSRVLGVSCDWLLGFDTKEVVPWR